MPSQTEADVPQILASIPCRPPALVPAPIQISKVPQSPVPPALPSLPSSSSPPFCTKGLVSASFWRLRRLSTWIRPRPSVEPAAPWRSELHAIHRCPPWPANLLLLAELARRQPTAVVLPRAQPPQSSPSPAGDGARTPLHRQCQPAKRTPAPIPPPAANFSAAQSLQPSGACSVPPRSRYERSTGNS